MRDPRGHAQECLDGVARDHHGSTGLTFETDPLGTFPLWCFEDDSRVVVTSEVKSLTALQGIAVELDETLCARLAILQTSAPSGASVACIRCNSSRFADAGADRGATYTAHLPTDFDVRD